MTPFLAQAGTFLISARKERGNLTVTRHVVVGWIHVQGSQCFPLLAINKDLIGGKKAILHPTGEVSDMVEGATFNGLDEWLAAISPQLADSESVAPTNSSVELSSGASNLGANPRRSRAKSGTPKQTFVLPRELESLI